MKRTVAATISVVLAVVFVFCLVSCSTVEKTGAWESATYLKDMELGNGSKTLVVEVKADNQLVTFTVETDKETVGLTVNADKKISISSNIFLGVKGFRQRNTCALQALGSIQHIGIIKEKVLPGGGRVGRTDGKHAASLFK